jgi:DNA end-binding protein Ku
MAGKLVESLHERFRPEDFQDSYRQRVLGLIEAKARGEEPEGLSQIPESGEEMPLAAALEARLGRGSKR